MSPMILELRDTALRLWRDQELIHQSPGFALNQTGNLVFGDAAKAQARLHPRDVEHRYWSELSLDPLKTTFAGKRHFADLAHAHLLDIAGQAENVDDTFIAVPSSFRRDQLALLLGILRESPFKAIGLIDGAVATTASTAPPGVSLLLEFHLHQAVLTRVENDGNMLRRVDVTPLPGLGVLSNNERIASAIAHAFIEQTRFDPRHTAAVEQELFDRLPDILGDLAAAGEIKVELGGYTARLQPETLADTLSDRFERIRESAGDRSLPLLLGQQHSVLPGIATLAENVFYVDAEASANAINKNSGTLRQEEETLAFVTALPAEKQAAEKPVAAEFPNSTSKVPPPAAETPTEEKSVSHVLIKHAAYPLTSVTRIGRRESEADIHIDADISLTLVREQGQINLVTDAAGVTVNGQPAVSGQKLARGDLIMLGGSGEILQLIAVIGSDGA